MDHMSHSSSSMVEMFCKGFAKCRYKKQNLLFFTCLQHVNQKLLFGRDKEQMNSLNENLTHPPREQAAPQCAELKRLEKKLSSEYCNALFSLSLNSVKDFQNKMCLLFSNRHMTILRLYFQTLWEFQQDKHEEQFIPHESILKLKLNHAKSTAMLNSAGTHFECLHHYFSLIWYLMDRNKIAHITCK